MPFPVYQVEPVKVSAKPVPEDCEKPLECVTNTTLCQVRLLIISDWDNERSCRDIITITTLHYRPSDSSPAY